MNYYRLDENHEIHEIEAADLDQVYVNPNRIIGKTKVGDLDVSTVFLGIDHNWMNIGAPLLFETMIFLDEKYPGTEYQTRCSTYQQALEMHQAGIDHAKKLLEELKK